MRKILVLTIPMILITVSLIAAAAGEESNDQSDIKLQPEKSLDQTNLLINPSFETGYDEFYIPPPPGHDDCPSGVCTTVIMADGWTPWWLKDQEFDHNPEYKRADGDFINPVRVRSGQSAQQYFSFESTHEAGFYQRVSVNNGQLYCFNIWGHAWSATDDDDAYSGPVHGWLDQKVGIDPSGGIDPESGNIKWGPPRLQYDVYGQFGVCDYAQSDLMTVFTHSKPLWSARHNDVYWDDAELYSPDLSSGISVAPTHGIKIIAEVGTNRIVTRTAIVNLPDVRGLIWTAELDSGGNLDISFSPNIGRPNDHIVVSVDSNGYPIGRYSAQIVINAELEMPGNPTILEVELEVVENLYSTFLPNASK